MNMEEETCKYIMSKDLKKMIKYNKVYKCYERVVTTIKTLEMDQKNSMKVNKKMN